MRIEVTKSLIAIDRKVEPDPAGGHFVRGMTDVSGTFTGQLDMFGVMAAQLTDGEREIFLEVEETVPWYEAIWNRLRHRRPKVFPYYSAKALVSATDDPWAFSFRTTGESTFHVVPDRSWATKARYWGRRIWRELTRER